MKKTIPAILLLIAVMLTFSGCKTKSSQPEYQPYTAYVDVGLADGDAGARVKAENRYTDRRRCDTRAREKHDLGHDA